MKIRRSMREPIREGLSWEERWNALDQGLIACWERGREKALENPALAELVKAGHLPVLGWKGGVEKKIKKKLKYGTFKYLAQWQGIRGDDLQIDTDTEPAITCTATQMTVVFTKHSAKYSEP